MLILAIKRTPRKKIDALPSTQIPVKAVSLNHYTEYYRKNYTLINHIPHGTRPIYLSEYKKTSSLEEGKKKGEKG